MVTAYANKPHAASRVPHLVRGDRRLAQNGDRAEAVTKSFVVQVSNSTTNRARTAIENLSFAFIMVFSLSGYIDSQTYQSRTPRLPHRFLLFPINPEFQNTYCEKLS